MRTHPTTALVCGLLACTVTASCTGPVHSELPAAPPPPPSVPAPATTATAPAGVRWPATGPLFGGSPGNPGEHFCTASVVASPRRDVVVTAAHCVATGDGTPPRTGTSFVPGYHDGASPFGAWTVTTAAVDPRWQASADPAHDIAFLTVSRPDSELVEDAIGGYQLVVDPGSTNTVDAVGYPDFADEPQSRSGTTTRFSPTQLELDAYGLFDGTSGGPWLCNENQLIAVTGGYQQGGSTPDVSYASYLDNNAQLLFAKTAGQPSAAGA